ncbi:LpqB family beta-propeller domain-containing protein [Nocardia sp. NPDC049737]|uniref:WD40 repeat domain-containing protein n=1 Tax=Nocardia sp. NPDC049737 TaxID=3154358 RepID=UPI003413AC96
MNGLVSEAAFSPDGQTLIVSAADTVELWNVRTHHRITTLTPCSAGDQGCPDQRNTCPRVSCSDSWYSSTAIAPDGRTLAAAGVRSSGDYSYRVVDIWDLPTRRLVATFANTDITPGGLVFGPDPHVLIGIGDEKAGRDYQHVATTWDVPSGRVLARMTFDAIVGEPAISHDGQHLAVIARTDPAAVEIWQLANGRKETTFDYRAIKEVTFSPDDRLLAMAAPDNSVILADTTGQHSAVKLFGPITLRFSPVVAVAISPNGTLLAGVTSAGLILLWNLRDNSFAGYTKIPDCPIGICVNDSSVATFSSDSQLLAVTRSSGDVDVFRLR